MDLTSNDYREILKFYRKTVPRLKSARKAKVERLIGKKLCSCIKKVKLEEKASIGICINSVLKRKGLKLYRFTCKKRVKLIQNKRGRALRKTRKKIL